VWEGEGEGEEGFVMGFGWGFDGNGGGWGFSRRCMRKLIYRFCTQGEVLGDEFILFDVYLTEEEGG